ncbi:MAG: SDR family NAD(P)-dependent oxidoreductase [Candidatus Humimicrobiaceae bacterium]
MEEKKCIFDLTGKVAIVTGSGRGIGKSLALALAREGADVVVADLNKENADQTCEEIKSLGRKSISIKADISKKDEVQDVFKKIMKHFGQLDIAINNAGVPGSRLPAAEDIDIKDFQRFIDIMLLGYFMCCQEEAKIMIRQKKGHIINIGAGAGTRPPRGIAGIAPYAAVKAGIKLMGQGLALDWAKYNITVNTISPGYIITPATEPIISTRGEMYTAQTPMGRIGLPADLDGAAVYLASDASNWTTGIDFVVDGGLRI